MANISKNLIELIGNTPLLETERLNRALGLKARIIVKIEAFNPGGSAKDRIALAMIQQAEKDGRLKPGATIVEPTSGNTGIGLAWVGAVKGYKVILTMPETMSDERKKLLRAYGATLVLTPGAEGMNGAIARAKQICEETPGAIILGQFDNPANPEIHRLSTGQEIWKDTDGKVDIFVGGVGTGGTVSGVGEALKAHNPAVRVVAVEPSSSPVLSGGKPGPHKIQGIGAGFVPRNYLSDYIDEVMQVTDEAAIESSRMLTRYEGVLAGISSGAALSAAITLASMEENAGKTIVALLPDTGERYLSTALVPGE